MLREFKAIITTNKEAQIKQHQQLIIVDLPFEMEVKIDKNNQIHDVQPRTFYGVDLFSKYHGRTKDWYIDLEHDMLDLYFDNNNE